MPVRKVKLKDGSIGYQWGTTGKIYKKREDAEKQGIAILLSQRKKRKMKISRQTYNELKDRLNKLEKLVNGGKGSGNFGHAGRPGKRGGSAPEGSSASGANTSKSFDRYKTHEKHNFDVKGYTSSTEALKAFFPETSEFYYDGDHFTVQDGDNGLEGVSDDGKRVVSIPSETLDQTSDYVSKGDNPVKRLSAFQEITHKMREHGFPASLCDEVGRYAMAEHDLFATKGDRAEGLKRVDTYADSARGAIKGYATGNGGTGKPLNAYDQKILKAISEQIYRGQRGVHEALENETTNSFTSTPQQLAKSLNGGKGSGNFGHSGRPGERGGSAPAQTGVPVTAGKTGADLYRAIGESNQRLEETKRHIDKIKHILGKNPQIDPELVGESSYIHFEQDGKSYSYEKRSETLREYSDDPMSRGKKILSPEEEKAEADEDWGASWNIKGSDIKKKLKSYGLATDGLSVRRESGGYSDAWYISGSGSKLDLPMIEKIVKRKLEHYDVDERSGEILAGGNTFVFVRDTDKNMLYQKLSNKIDELTLALNGGEGSGFFGHAGRPGKIGGSAPEGETSKKEASKNPVKEVDAQISKLDEVEKELGKDTSIGATPALMDKVYVTDGDKKLAKKLGADVEVAERWAEQIASEKGYLRTRQMTTGFDFPIRERFDYDQLFKFSPEHALEIRRAFWDSVKDQLENE